MSWSKASFALGVPVVVVGLGEMLAEHKSYAWYILATGVVLMSWPRFFDWRYDRVLEKLEIARKQIDDEAFFLGLPDPEPDPFRTPPWYKPPVRKTPPNPPQVRAWWEPLDTLAERAGIKLGLARRAVRWHKK
jgi:hypothetical protein